MKIGVDAYYLDTPLSSIGIFQRNILVNLLNLDSENEYFIFTTSNSNNALGHIARDEAQFCFSRKNLSQRNAFMFKKIRDLSISVFYFTFNISPTLVNGTRYVIQNHDWVHGTKDLELGNILKPLLYRRMHIRSSSLAQQNISNSVFTQSETFVNAGAPSRVIYHDCDPFYKRATSNDFSDLLADELDDYVLYVGRTYPKYKNVNTLLLAYKTFSKDHPNIPLLIVHSDHLRSEDVRYIKKEELDVRSFSNVSIEQVKHLYSNCKIFIYPSLYEGFGAPIIEAQASGAPVISSDKGSLPEVCGEGAVLFDGSSIDLAEKMEWLLEDSFQNKLKYYGRKNALRFDWKETARQTLGVLMNERTTNVI